MPLPSAASMGTPGVAHVRPPFRRDFQIAIICALSLEYDAASLLIDEFWDQGGQQYGRISGDSNTYRNGRIGMHNVVLMLLPNMGKVSVAGSAASLRASYVGVRLAFLVGVCGGVPGIREMLLGDVVISDDLVQYDFGRQYPGAFVAKDTIQVHPGLSSKNIRSLVSYFKTEAGKRDLQDDAAESLIDLQDSAVAKRYQNSYEYPGSTEDKLFEATYRHRHREPSSCDFCCGEAEEFCEKAAGTSCTELGCDENRLVPRQRLEVHRHGQPQTHGPEVFIGRIASADMVMKSGEHRDRFAEKYDVIAFEMEGAGIWDEIPCIVVKGVCDYADSHKSKSWQPFAAATAAAVTKSILNRYNFADNAQFIRHDAEFPMHSQSDYPGSDVDTDESKSVQSSMFETNMSAVSNISQDNQWESLQDATFHFRRALTSKQCQILREIQEVPSVDSVLVFTAQLDSCNRDRKGSSIASRFYSALKSVRDFSAIIQGFSCPTGLPVILWASVKVTIKVIFGTFTHYDAASKLFMDLGHLCPQAADYGSLYPASAPLQKSLIKLYASVVRCCTDILRLVRRPWYEFFFSSSRDLSQYEFESQMDEIQRYNKAFWGELLATRNSTQQLTKPKKGNAQRAPWLKGLFPQSRNNTGQSGAWRVGADELRARTLRQQLLDSLSTHDHLTPLKQSRRKRHAGTAEWLFDTKEFRDWTNNINFTVFWCSGKIGSGKTILAASVIDKLLTHKADEKSYAEISVAFFLVRFDDEESTKADVILRSILRQAIDMAGLDDQTKGMLEKWQNDLLSETEDVAQILCTVIKKLRNFHIVIDGLDECEKQDRNTLLNALSAISSVTQDLRIFLCGRESMSREVEKAFQSLIHLSMNCQPAKSDIPKYIESAVQERLQNEELIVGNQVLIDEIKEALKRGADGMFLWVAFQLDALCSQHCDDDIRQAIRDLPSDLTETFKRAVRRIITRRNTDIASKCFQWVAAAKRPLSIDELREAISIEIGQQYSKPERLPNNMKKISSFCENLVHVDEEKHIVQFAHHTVKQFLIDEVSDPEFRAFHFKLEDVDHFIGEICVTYLNFNDFNTTLMRRPRPPQQVVLSDIGRTAVGSEKKSHSFFQTVARLKLGAGNKPKAVDFVRAFCSPKPQTIIATDEIGHPFLRYASANMILHTTGFRKDRSVTYGHWRMMINDGNDLLQYPWGSGSFRGDNPAALKWCFINSHIGLIRVISSFKRVSPSKEQNDSLCRAVEASNLDLVEALLDSGSDPDAVSDDGRSAIVIAAGIRSLEVVDKLLFAGAHVNNFESHMMPALHIAAQSGNTDIVNRLIIGGANLDFVFLGWSALHLAGQGGHPEVVEALLTAGADISLNGNGATEILDLAATCGYVAILHDSVVAGYIAHEFDENQICTAIFTAVTNDHPEIVLGIMDIRCKRHHIPIADEILWMATECGHLGVLKYAIAHGAHVNIPRFDWKFGMMPLQKAAELDCLDMVDILIAAGACMGAFADGPEMILRIAVKHGSLKTLEEALAAGADVNTVLDKDEGYTALHIAANSAALKVLNRLTKESKSSRSDYDYDHHHDYDLTAERESRQVIDILLDAGADVKMKSKRGLTAVRVATLQWALMLRERSAGQDSSALTTDEGWQALEAALRGCNLT